MNRGRKLFWSSTSRIVVSFFLMHKILLLKFLKAEEKYNMIKHLEEEKLLKTHNTLILNEGILQTPIQPEFLTKWRPANIREGICYMTKTSSWSFRKSHGIIDKVVMKCYHVIQESMTWNLMTLLKSKIKQAMLHVIIKDSVYYC